MRSELDILLGTAIDSLVKLEVVIYLHNRPGTVHSADQIAAKLRRPREAVRAALEPLSADGLIERFPLGTGRHVLYGPSEDAHVQELLDLLHREYDAGGDSRARLVQQVLGRTDGHGGAEASNT